MSENSKIEWCDDSASAWWGCEKVAPGCKSCYALTLSKRYGHDLWGGQAPRLYIQGFANTIRRLDRKAAKEGRPRIVFINSMSDFFEGFDGPVIDRESHVLVVDGSTIRRGHGASDSCRPLTLADLRRDAFALFDQCPHLRFLLLTKRPQNVRRMWTERKPQPGFTFGTDEKFVKRPNVWLGASCSDQPTADAVVPELLRCRDLSPVLFLSAEPLLGPVDLRPKAPDAYAILGKFYGTGTFDPSGMSPAADRVLNCFPKIDWVILGGESGHSARPCRVEWVRDLVRQCQAAGVKCFVKQLGDFAVAHTVSDLQIIGSGCHSLLSKKGGDPSEWPADLHVRQMPEVNR